jgi:carbonic anhydrase
MTKHFFWGVYAGNEGDEMWKTLHEHFEKLAREDDDRQTEFDFSNRKAVKCKESLDG